MRRIRLTIAYDGTEFCGFQVQPGQRTVEGELNRALSELTGEQVTVIGASRTDSGVHALGNAAVFDTVSSIPADKFPFALLPYLPEDMRIVSGCEVPGEWHPRRTDCVKTYEYVYDCGQIEDPLLRRYSSFCRRVPDISRMREAAAYLVGEHDFTSFANPSSQVLRDGGSAVRTIYGIEITEEPRRAYPVLQKTAAAGGAGSIVCPEYSTGCRERSMGSPECGIANQDSKAGSFDCGAGSDVSCGYSSALPGSIVRIRVSGSGFLYNMVRIIAGTLMQVGTGLWEPARIQTALEARDRTQAGPTAEARGLTLLGIRYMDDK